MDPQIDDNEAIVILPVPTSGILIIGMKVFLNLLWDKASCIFLFPQGEVHRPGRRISLL